jgi:hypothetical protein
VLRGSLENFQGCAGRALGAGAVVEGIEPERCSGARSWAGASRRALGGHHGALLAPWPAVGSLARSRASSGSIAAPSPMASITAAVPRARRC